MQQSLLPNARLIVTLPAPSRLSRVLALPLLLLPLAASPACGQTSFQGLGFFPRGYESRAEGISGDGRTVIGNGDEYGFESHYTLAFRWTSETGLATLGWPMGCAGGTSTDGTVIVGGVGQAYVWADELGATFLQPPHGNSEITAWRCSADGRVVVGESGWENASAMRWTRETGTILIGLLPGDITGGAYGVSADGNTIVGGSYNGQLDEAFLWRPETGIRPLPGMPEGVVESTAMDVSPDGRVIVGFANNGDLGQPFRWTAETSVVGLGLPPGDGYGWANAVSADGRVIVGDAYFPGPDHLYIWTAARGFRGLRDVLLDAGVNDVAGWDLFEAIDISDDGTTIVGSGYNPDGLIEAWVAHIPRDCPADFDGDDKATLFDFLAFQNAFAASEPEGDCNSDGQFDLFDFLCFANVFKAGC